MMMMTMVMIVLIMRLMIYYHLVGSHCISVISVCDNCRGNSRNANKIIITTTVQSIRRLDPYRSELDIFVAD